MTTADEIIKRIEADQAELVRLYRSVPVTAIEAEDLPSGWSVKDTLGHLAAWQWICADWLQAAHESNEPLAGEIDRLAQNREIYEEHKEWSWEEIEYDFRAAHKTLLEAIRQLPPARLNEVQVQQVIARETWQRYADHLPDLRRWHRRINRNR